MKVCNVVFAFGGVKEICLRHLPIWKKFSDELIFVSPLNDKLEIEGERCVYSGISETHHESLIKRTIFGIANALALDCDSYVLMEYDALFLSRPIIMDAVQANVFGHNDTHIWESNICPHFPWVFSRSTLEKLWEGFKIAPLEQGFVDRWLGEQLKLLKIPTHNFIDNNQGFSTHELTPDFKGFKDALNRGAFAIHGIKTQEVFDMVKHIQHNPDKKKPIVATYWEEMNGWQQDGLMEEWENSWRRNGWEPVVLRKEDLEKHPLLVEIQKHVEYLPTINNKQYEVACYLRWLAFELSGSQMCVDMDLINYSFTPEDAEKLPQDKVVSLIHNGCPAAIHMPSGYRMWKHILNYKITHCGWENGIPHSSDQNMIIRLIDEKHEDFMAIDFCKQYGDAGWDNAPLVHFANGAIYSHGGGRTRIDVIREK